jgi:hypothetical protein
MCKCRTHLHGSSTVLRLVQPGAVRLDSPVMTRFILLYRIHFGTSSLKCQKMSQTLCCCFPDLQGTPTSTLCHTESFPSSNRCLRGLCTTDFTSVRPHPLALSCTYTSRLAPRPHPRSRVPANFWKEPKLENSPVGDVSFASSGFYFPVGDLWWLPLSPHSESIEWSGP